MTSPDTPATGFKIIQGGVDNQGNAQGRLELLQGRGDLAGLHGTIMLRSLGQGLGVCIAALGLSYTIARDFLAGLLTSHRPILRTSKGNLGCPLLRNLLVAREELVLVCVLWAGFIAFLATHSWNDMESLIWLLVMGTQSIPYLCAVILSITSGLSPFALSPDR